MSKQQATCSIRHSTFDMSNAISCLLLRHVALTCCWCGRGFKVGYNQGYLATVKMNEKYILKIKREKNDHKNMNMKDRSVRL